MTRSSRANQDGFMLVGLIVAIFIILLVVAVAAPRVAKALRRDKEVEAIHRGNQYVRAVQLYYRKTGHYPGSIDQLEKTNNIRFLRQRYADPMTGKPDWRLIHVGEAKTTVKGFFGKPLSGLNTSGSGIGGASTPGQSVGTGSAGAGSTQGSGSAGSSFGSSSFGGSSFGGSGSGASGSGASSFGSGSGSGSGFGSSAGAGGSSAGASGFGAGTGTSGSGIGSQSATTFSGGGAPIVGISSVAAGSSITVLNEQTTYAAWEFLYDPRIEQLKGKTNLLGGSGAGTPASSLGSTSGFGTPGSGVNGTAPNGTAPTAPTTSGTNPPQ